MSAQSMPYAIWRRQAWQRTWIQTAHTVNARTYGEARSKMVSKFAGAGFSSMSLIALPPGENPNAAAVESIS